MQALAQIHQVQDVLLETRSTETDGGLQEPRSDTRIVTNSMSNFVDVGSGGFTDGGEGIDR